MPLSKAQCCGMCDSVSDFGVVWVVSGVLAAVLRDGDATDPPPLPPHSSSERLWWNDTSPPPPLSHNHAVAK